MKNIATLMKVHEKTKKHTEIVPNEPSAHHQYSKKERTKKAHHHQQHHHFTDTTGATLFAWENAVMTSPLHIVAHVFC